MSGPADSSGGMRRSPFAGCAILIAAGAVMLFLVSFSVISLFRQYREIERFTSDKAAPVLVDDSAGSEAVLNRLAERLEGFRQRLAAGEECSLSLTPAECNLLIASREEFRDFRGTLRVADLRNGALRIEISFPLNGMPRLAREGEPGWLGSDPRYLNGTLVAKPALSGKEVVLEILDIKVPGRSVPRGFIEQMSPYRLAERYLADPALGPAMAALTRIETRDGAVVFSHRPGDPKPGVISEGQVDAGSRRLFTVLGWAACLFLAFAGTVIVMGLRARAARERNR